MAICRPGRTYSPQALRTVAAAVFIATTGPSWAQMHVDHKFIECPTTAPAGTEYVTVLFDINKLEMIDEGDGSPNFEIKFSHQAVVTELASDGRPIAPYHCDRSFEWEFDLPVYNITYGGRMNYPLDLRAEITNVPLRSRIIILVKLWEVDDFADDFADLNPFDGQKGEWGGVVIEFYPEHRNGKVRTYFNDARIADIRDGVLFRTEGDGKGTFVDFRAAMEGTMTVTGTRGTNTGSGTPVSPLPMQSLGSLGLANDPVCRDYALKAVEMNQEAQKFGCGFAPPIWSNDHQMHFEWCMHGQNIAAAPEQHRGRSRELDACREANAGTTASPQPPAQSGGAQDKATLCATYAGQAVAAAQKNVSLGCGLTGPRWSADHGAHLGWCMVLGTADLMSGEISARDKALRTCRGG